MTARNPQPMPSPQPTPNPQRRRPRCRHFNGVQHDRCRAGISYDDVHKVISPGNALPCLCAEIITCSARSFLTEDEIQAEETARYAHLERTLLAMAAAKTHAAGRRRFAAAIACPVCGTGTLHYVVASNGHMHGSCSIADCVRWME